MSNQKTVADIRAQIANMPDDMLITPANIFGIDTGKNPPTTEAQIQLQHARPKMVYANIPSGGK